MSARSDGGVFGLGVGVGAGPDAGHAIVGWKREFTRMLRTRLGPPVGVEAATAEALLNVLREATTIRSVDCLPDDPRLFDPSVHATVGDVTFMGSDGSTRTVSPRAAARLLHGVGGSGGGRPGRPGVGVAAPRLQWRVLKLGGGPGCSIDLPLGDGVTDGFSSVARMIIERKAQQAPTSLEAPQEEAGDAHEASPGGNGHNLPALRLDAPLFAHADGSSWTVGEVRAAVKSNAQKLGLDPSNFAERSLNVGGKAELSGAGKVMMHA